MAASAEALKQSSPLARVKEEFGGKDKLVDKLVGVIDAGDASKDELRKRLLGVANSKLIRLFAVATKAKQAGGHDKLVASTAEKLNRAKDKDFVAKLDGYSDARLLDVLQVAERGSAAAAAAAAPRTDGATAPEARAARAAKRAAAARPAAKAQKPAAKKSAAASKKKPASKTKKKR